MKSYTGTFLFILYSFKFSIYAATVKFATVTFVTVTGNKFIV